VAGADFFAKYDHQFKFPIFEGIAILRRYPASERQKAFAREFKVDFHVRNAAIRAGYPPKGAANYGQRLLRTEIVQKLLLEEAKSPEPQDVLSRDAVVKGVLDIAEGRTPETTIDHRLKAYALLQKFLGPGNMTQFMKFQAAKVAHMEKTAAAAPVVEEKKPEPPPLPPSGSLEAFLSDRKH
jgi:hypothetical protein